MAPSAVPHGSGLGPIFLSLFINDLNLLFRFVRSLLYADDTKFFICVNSPLNCSKPQRDISAFAGWATYNGLPLIAAKCAVIAFFLSQTNIGYTYKIGDTNFNRVSSIKDLGVLFDENFAVSDHFESVYNRAVRTLGSIKRATYDFKHTNSIIYLYKTIVNLLLTYRSTFWLPY